MRPDPPTPDSDLIALRDQLLEHQEGTPERQAYLERLRAMVRSGEYKPDSEALAAKLLEQAADQILPRQRSEEDDPGDAK